ncbi:MAG: Crp/Fnr family transcriptional regulator [Flavobacteriales bacterium]|nr:Crp/Fnr family transcriptional regulator [Flavobacteriales bacterium]MCB9364010.1 Crp/Fnr family transcriptional regulator [Flavobacteriales bacterium]
MTNNRDSCLNCENNNCFIKRYSPISIIDDVNKNKMVSRFPRKQHIFHEGNENPGIFFVKSGVVKVYKNGAFNKDQIIRFSLNGEILGHRGLQKSTIFSVSAQTLTESEVCFFTREYFFYLLEKVPQLTINLMLFYAEELNQEESKLRDMAIFNVREKVAKALLTLVERFGLKTNKEIKYIEKLSRQDIAELVGLTSNQVTKVLADFKSENLIEIEGKKIRLAKKPEMENIIAI